jgi:ribosomal protein S18 acetylase RimI-like enzyme
MTPTFRAASPADVDTVLRFTAQLYSRTGFHESRARAACHDLLAHPEWGGLWLIQAGGRAVGYMVITLCYSLEFAGRFALLDELFVEAEWRGRGIGSHALAFADEFCISRSLKTIRLEVARHNSRALELYQRSGFQVEDRDLMTKRLGRPDDRPLSL